MGSCFLDHETRKIIVKSSGMILPGAMVLTCPSGGMVIAPAQPSISYIKYFKLCQVTTATEHDADLINGDHTGVLMRKVILLHLFCTKV